MSDTILANFGRQAFIFLQVAFFAMWLNVFIQWDLNQFGWIGVLQLFLACCNSKFRTQFKLQKTCEACSNGISSSHTEMQKNGSKQHALQPNPDQYLQHSIKSDLRDQPSSKVCRMHVCDCSERVMPADDTEISDLGTCVEAVTDLNNNVFHDGTVIETKFQIDPLDNMSVQETTAGDNETMHKDLQLQFTDNFKPATCLRHHQSELVGKHDSMCSQNQPSKYVLQNLSDVSCSLSHERAESLLTAKEKTSLGTTEKHVSIFKKLLTFIGELYIQVLYYLVLLGTLAPKKSQTPKHVQQIQETCSELTGNTFENPDHLNEGNTPEEDATICHTQDDVKREQYRLATFRNYLNSRINTSLFAKAGFYFTGLADRVQCFACNHVLENVSSTLDPLLLRHHETTCPFIRGPGSHGNIPIGNQATSVAVRQHISPSASVPPVLSGGARPNGPTATVRNPMYQTARVISSSSSFSNDAPPRRNNAPIERHLADIPDPVHQTLIQQLDLCNEVDRVRSFTHAWNRDTLPTPRRMANAGWFYLGNLDRTQCFSCGGVLRNWRMSDIPSAEHVRHFPQCAMAMGAEARNIPEQEPQQLPPISVRRLTEQEKIDLRNMFPCADPRTPEMRSHQSRTSTFTNWVYTRATPAMLAEAGFFSLGVRDRVKCYYCNGGLQNWRRNDDPWEQHAKWYPNCEYVLRNRGPEYIHSVVARYPDIDRPTLRTTRQNVPPPLSGRSSQSMQLLPAPEIVDPQIQMQQELSLLEEVMHSEIASTVLGMGFSEEQVRATIQSQIENQGESFATAESLLNAVLQQSALEEVGGSNLSLPVPEVNDPHHLSSDSELEDLDLYSSNMVLEADRGIDTSDSPIQSRAHSSLSNHFTQRQRTSSPSQGQHSFASQAGTSMILTGGSIVSVQDSLEKQREQLERLRSDRLCKVCLDRRADMVFVPCSHLCCCMECTIALRKCPVCRKHIVKAVRTYAE